MVEIKVGPPEDEAEGHLAAAVVKFGAYPDPEQGDYLGAMRRWRDGTWWADSRLRAWLGRAFTSTGTDYVGAARELEAVIKEVQDGRNRSE